MSDPAVPDDAVEPGPPPVRLAVVGCGAVAERYHLPALLAEQDVVVTAFVDPSTARSRALADRVPGPRRSAASTSSQAKSTRCC
jgi:predicted dehydrogenase